MYLQIEQISKRYGDIAALDNVSVDVGRQEFVCLLGPSGCGKTTLLPIVSGLVEPDDGRVILDSRDIRPEPATQRGFGIVFQSYSLFPNMTVAENIGYGLRIRRRSRQEIDKRVALARAIAIDPHLLLLDEPLSAPDAKLRLSLRDEVRSLQRRLGIPADGSPMTRTRR